MSLVVLPSVSIRSMTSALFRTSSFLVMLLLTVSVEGLINTYIEWPRCLGVVGSEQAPVWSCFAGIWSWHWLQCCACTCLCCVLIEIQFNHHIKPAHNSISHAYITLQHHGSICIQFNKQCFNTISCIDWQWYTRHLVLLNLFCNYCILLLTYTNQALYLVPCKDCIKQ